MTSIVNCETVADFGSSQLRVGSERKDEHFMPDDPVLIASTIRFEATFTVSHHSAGARGFPVCKCQQYGTFARIKAVHDRFAPTDELLDAYDGKEVQRFRARIKGVRLRGMLLGAIVGTLGVAFASAAAAQATTGMIRVDVTDSSGAKMPGVLVIATTADGRIPVKAVTDKTGTYVFRAVPVGPVILRFQLDGFTGAAVGITVEPGAESHVAQQLEVAPLQETVVVRAPLPVEPPKPAPPAPVVAAPRGPLLKPVPPHERDSVCGPAKPSPATQSLGTIRSTRDVAEGGLYTIGRQLAIEGGTLNGLEVGQNLVVRHYFKVRSLAGSETTGEHSAGLVQVVSVTERSSIAAVIYACDAFRNGDFLVSFRPESVRPPEPRGVPDYDAAARILYADDAQTLGAPQRLMVIDRGSVQGVRVGQRCTIFRRHGSGSPEITGEAIVVAVRLDSATIRIERVSNAIAAGDLAAPQIPAPAAGR
jgi:hypothetical protein